MCIDELEDWRKTTEPPKLDKTVLGNERQVAYCRVRDAIRTMKGAVTRKRALDEIHRIANSDTDWKP
jgi:hypothetical protein